MTARKHKNSRTSNKQNNNNNTSNLLLANKQQQEEKEATYCFASFIPIDRSKLQRTQVTGIMETKEDSESKNDIAGNGSEEKKEESSSESAKANEKIELSKLSEAAVLAHAYVPEAQRLVNQSEAGLFLTDTSCKVNEDALQTFPFVPFTPHCGHEPKCFPFPHQYPIRKFPPELYYAVQRYKQQLMNPKGTEELDWKKLASVNEIANMTDYCTIWEQILVKERQAVLLLYERYSQYNVKIKILDSQPRMKAEVQIAGIADASPPLMIGDIVLIRPLKHLPIGPHYSNPLMSIYAPVEIQATIESIERRGDFGKLRMSWVSFQDHNWLKSVYSRKRFNLRFIPSAASLQRCLTALDFLTNMKGRYGSTLMEMLFPENAPVVPVCRPALALLHETNTNQSLEADLSQLNQEQLSFVNMVTARTLHPAQDQVRPPMILTGPAGTGKTRTMIVAMRNVIALAEHRKRPCRILVCTSSHTAADVITRRLGEYMHPQQLFRLFDMTRPVETVPTSVLKFCRQSARTGSFELPLASELLKMQVIVATCSDAHLLYRIGLTNHQLRVRRTCFEGYLRETCSVSNIGVEMSGINEPHFTHLFVDEAAQATEPETMISLSVVVDPEPGSDKVEIALVGDPRQLEPAVYCDKAAVAGLQHSLMERLLKRPRAFLGGDQEMLGPKLLQLEDWLKYSFQKDGQEQLSVFLTVNYRCHPSFLMMPSILFYFDRLVSAGLEKDGAEGESFWLEKLRWVESLSKPVKLARTESDIVLRKEFSWPIHCIGVEGKDKSVTIKSGFPSTTWTNEEEAKVISDVVVALTREQGVRSEMIGVMAPFRGQVVAIRKHLRSRGLPQVNVGTVEDFQAVECKVCLISLTRSTTSFVKQDIDQRVGLFGQPKRSNVALTRGENLMIVVGSPTVMSGDPIWRQFLLFCLRHGLMYGVYCATATHDCEVKVSNLEKVLRSIP